MRPQIIIPRTQLRHCDATHVKYDTIRLIHDHSKTWDDKVVMMPTQKVEYHDHDHGLDFFHNLNES